MDKIEQGCLTFGMKKLRFTILSVLFLLTACGKYLPPIEPEEAAPEPLTFATQRLENGVLYLTWNAPTKQLRGKELKDLDGYLVYRKEILNDPRLPYDDISYELLATIPDASIAEREQARKAAREEGKIGRRIMVPNDKKTVQYSDNTIVDGKTYLYKIVAYNQSDVEGDADQLVRLRFFGEKSEIALIDNPEPKT